MTSVQWEQIDKDQFNVFIRDLSLHSNTNLKHMIEDLDKATPIQSDSKNKNKKKYKTVTPKYKIKIKSLLILFFI